MFTTSPRTLRTRHLIALVPLGLVVTACGSTPSSSGQPSSPTSGSTQLVSHTGAAGTYMTDANGRAVYQFTADQGMTSACNAACLAVWPAVTEMGHQVDFQGHLVYYYSGDSAPGDTKGEGINHFGGLWWLITPAGSPLMTSTPTPSASSSAPAPGRGY